MRNLTFVCNTSTFSNAAFASQQNVVFRIFRSLLMLLYYEGRTWKPKRKEKKKKKRHVFWIITLPSLSFITNSCCCCKPWETFSFAFSYVCAEAFLLCTCIACCKFTPKKEKTKNAVSDNLNKIWYHRETIELYIEKGKKNLVDT